MANEDDDRDPPPDETRDELPEETREEVPPAEELIRELRERQRAGEDVTLEEYCRRYPSRRKALLLLESIPEEELPRSPQEEAAIDLGSVGEYELIRKLGEGGYGTVYLARQPGLPRDVALKVLRADRASRGAVARFRRELAALCSMQHRAVATIFEAGETDEGNPYFVMEYIAGEPITEYVQKHDLSTREKLELFLEICDGVQHAHLRGFLHRDLKPLNILVRTGDDGEAVAKVIDFGLARHFGRHESPDTRMTRSGDVIGTLDYLSPEQARGQSQMDERVDVYALGVILYELITGEHPLRAAERASLPDILRRILEEEPLRPSARVREREGAASDSGGSRLGHRREELAAEVDYIILRALEKDPRRRYASVANLALDIARHLRGEPLAVAGPTSALYRLRKLARKHRVGILASLVFLLLVGFPAAYWAVGRWQAHALRREAVTSVAEYRQLADEVRSTYRRWRELRHETDTRAPVWFRGEELAAWERLVELLPATEPAYTAALAALSKAEDNFDESLSLRTELAATHHAHAEDGTPGVSEIRDRLPVSIPGVLPGDSSRIHVLTIETEPPGAIVHCYRHVWLEGRWVPLPFDAASSTVGDFSLVVDDHPEPVEPFEAGDRIVRVNGEDVSSLSDLDKALRGVRQEQAIVVLIERKDTVRKLEWTPFTEAMSRWIAGAPKFYGYENLDVGYTERVVSDPESGAIRLLDPFFQLDLSIRAYSLDRTPSNKAGATNQPLRLELPGGSYLFVLEKEGYSIVRFPVLLEGRDRTETIRLLSRDNVPPGFVYVPAGSVATGGDVDAFESFALGVHDVKGFFLSRFELTWREWAEFLDESDRADPESGLARELSPEVRELRSNLPERYRKEFPVQLADKEYWVRKGDRWDLNRTPDFRDTLDNPARGISYHAILEYLHWRNERAAASGEPWRYRLPSDLEWERAARGVDRRLFVWGNYLVWSFCWSADGFLKPKPPVPGAAFMDESVFGIRDLNGSVREHTTGSTRRWYCTVRGGSFHDTDDEWFRLASQNGVISYKENSQCGVRLAADLVRTDPGSP